MQSMQESSTIGTPFGTPIVPPEQEGGMTSCAQQRESAAKKRRNSPVFLSAQSDGYGVGPDDPGRRRSRCSLAFAAVDVSLCHVGPAIPGIELWGDQLGELGRDVCQRVFCSTQAASRAEQGADFAERFVGRVVHNGDELVTRKECR
jgi:hypothetical protein